jgi:hypothetical protein
MLMVEEQLQQQQHHAGGSSSNGRNAMIANFMLQDLLTTLQSIGIAHDISDAMLAAWHEVARPTAALLEHIMHMQLLYPERAIDNFKTEVWGVVSSMLWANEDDVLYAWGPLLQAALPGEALVAAAAAAADDAAQAAEAGLKAAEAAAAAAADLDAARLSALFSMCISAIKLLRRQTQSCSPYIPKAASSNAGADSEGSGCHPCVVVTLQLRWQRCNSFVAAMGHSAAPLCAARCGMAAAG